MFPDPWKPYVMFTDVSNKLSWLLLVKDILVTRMVGQTLFSILSLR